MNRYSQDARQEAQASWSESSDSIDPQRVVWIDRQSVIPDVCCTCGMFTDRRVRVKAVQFVTKPAGQANVSMVLISVVMHLVLGPIGWLVSSMLEGEEDPQGTKTVRQKSKVRISQCQLCHASQPAESLLAENHRFAFQVHPKFKREFDGSN